MSCLIERKTNSPPRSYNESGLLFLFLAKTNKKNLADTKNYFYLVYFSDLLLSRFYVLIVDTIIMEKDRFDVLSKRVRGKLLALAQSFTLPSGVEPDDVVQEAMIALWELTEQGYPIKDSEAMAIRLTKNICVNHYRKEHLKEQALTHDNFLGGIEATILTDSEDLKRIQKSVYSSLTTTQREYLHLRNDEGLSLDEIALRTGKPKTSIKSTLSKARKHMLEQIKGHL